MALNDAAAGRADPGGPDGRKWADRDRIGRGGAPCKDAPAGTTRRRPWTAPLLVYLATTLPLLLLGAGDAAAAWLLVVPVHLAVAAWVWMIRRRPGMVREAAGRGPVGGARRTVLADWTFPLALPFLYAELPLLMEGMPGAVRYHDAAVASLEGALFGGQPAFEWAGALSVPALSELFHLAYLSYYPLVFVPPALLWLGWAGPRDPLARCRAFDGTVLALTLAMLPAFAVMVAWPVQGPRYLGVPPGIPDGPVRSLVLAVLEAGSSRGAAFPSSHVSLAVAQALVALRWQPRVGVGTAFLAVFLSLGAVYGGFHYGVDVLAGALLGILAGTAGLRWSARGADPAAPPHLPTSGGERRPEGETPSPDRG